MDCPKPPSVMDIEASGFGPQSYPIEIGYCLSSGEKFCTLIKPLNSWTHWDSSAEKLHGIAKQSLIQVGMDVRAVCTELNQRLMGATLYSDGWVVDKLWLNALYVAAHLEPAFSLRAIENIQTENQYFTWDKVKQHLLRQGYMQRHRASADAEFVQQVFLRTLDESPIRDQQ